MNIPTIFIIGVPRSGTSWLGQIFKSSESVNYKFQPFFSYEFKDLINEDSDTDEIKYLLKKISESDSIFLNQTDKQNNFIYPKFENSNYLNSTLVIKENKYQSLTVSILRKIKNVRMIALVRHPCAVLYSWMKIPSEFPSGSNIILEWRYARCKNKGPEDCFGFDMWKKSALNYLDLQKRYPKRFKVVGYTNLIQEPNKIICELFDFGRLNFNDSVKKFITQSRSQSVDNPYAVYKKRLKDDSWIGNLPDEIIDQIYLELTGTELECFLNY